MTPRPGASTGARPFRSNVHMMEWTIPTTPYFREQVLAKRPYLRQDWIELALRQPLQREMQPEDSRIRHWVLIPEQGRYRPVVTLEDGQTVHNAFFDRGYKEPTP